MEEPEDPAVFQDSGCMPVFGWSNQKIQQFPRTVAVCQFWMEESEDQVLSMTVAECQSLCLSKVRTFQDSGCIPVFG